MCKMEDSPHLSLNSAVPLISMRPFGLFLEHCLINTNRQFWFNFIGSTEFQTNVLHCLQ